MTLGAGNGVRLTGGCLCGAVRFTAEDVGAETGACHCGMCRRWASGPSFAVLVGGLAIEGEEHVTRHRSSTWAERAFCDNCGTKLFFRVVPTDQHLVSLGAFEDQARGTFAEQIFTDEKPGFYDFADSTRMMTGAEAMAAFGFVGP